MCHVWHMMTYFNARGGIIHYITSIIHLRSGPRELPPLRHSIITLMSTLKTAFSAPDGLVYVAENRPFPSGKNRVGK